MQRISAPNVTSFIHPAACAIRIGARTKSFSSTQADQKELERELLKNLFQANPMGRGLRIKNEEFSGRTVIFRYQQNCNQITMNKISSEEG